MLEEISSEVEQYLARWQNLVNSRNDQDHFAGYRPVAIGWKVADRAEYDKLYRELHDQADTIIEKWMNSRWIAKIHLKDSSLPGGITLIKLMERRPGSSDAIGLDHLDFYNPEAGIVSDVLAAEKDLKWTHESNDVLEGYDWISVWFEGTEAKLKADTVLDIVITELAELNKVVKQ
jgi:hypothetical protein